MTPPAIQTDPLHGRSDSPKTCYHCGDPCGNSDIRIEDKRFCCNGCKQVFLLLESTDMCNYYDLNRNPGVTPKEYNAANKFSYLDDPDIQRQLIDFSDGSISRVRFNLPDMHCSSCIWLLEKINRLKEGVASSEVNFPRREISISFNPEIISLREVVELLASLGYEPRIRLSDVSEKVKTSTRRRLYIHIGVAGFAFANIMLLSFPEYLSSGEDMSEKFKNFFGYLNILLSLPVLFISARDYFASAITGLKQRMVNIDVPIVLGILTLFFRSVYEILSQSGPGYMDSFTGLIFLLLTGKLFQQKTYDSLSFDRDYRSYFPVSVHRRIPDGEEVIPLSKLRIGDRIIIRNGEIIPADSILIKSEARIDYSFVTGESEPVVKRSGEMIYAGGIQTGGAIELDVVKELSQSYLTQLWNRKKTESDTRRDIVQLTDRISRVFTIVVLSIATLSALYWFSRDPSHAWNAFTAVLIIACPCALALSAPYTLGNVLRIMGRNRLYLKNSHVIESMSRTDTIVFDKTGTLTYSGITRLRFMPLDDTDETLTKGELTVIRSLVNQSNHPLSVALFKRLTNGSILPVDDYEELPGEGICGTVDGCRIKLGSAGFTGAEEAESTASRVYIALDGKVRGYFNLENIYRKGMDELIRRLKDRYRLYLLSGDNDREMNRLSPYFGEGNLFFSQSPFQKRDFIKRLRSEGASVLMIGDGLNDAGALELSHVGIAISEDKNAFSPACDGILDAKNLQNLPILLDFSSGGVRIIQASFLISFAYNAVGLAFAVSGSMSPLIAAVLMPVSSISVILFATIATNVIARRMGLSITDES